MPFDSPPHPYHALLPAPLALNSSCSQTTITKRVCLFSTMDCTFAAIILAALLIADFTQQCLCVYIYIYIYIYIYLCDKQPVLIYVVIRTKLIVNQVVNNLPVYTQLKVE